MSTGYKLTTTENLLLNDITACQDISGCLRIEQEKWISYNSGTACRMLRKVGCGNAWYSPPDLAEFPGLF
jgi:hypothetical protein